MHTKSRSEARKHTRIIHGQIETQDGTWRLLSRGIMHYLHGGFFYEHAADNNTCTDWFFYPHEVQTPSQPASGCVFLIGAMRVCVSEAGEEKRQRAAGTNPSATQITSGLSGHIGAQRA